LGGLLEKKKGKTKSRAPFSMMSRRGSKGSSKANSEKRGQNERITGMITGNLLGG